MTHRHDRSASVAFRKASLWLIPGSGGGIREETPGQRRGREAGHFQNLPDLDSLRASLDENLHSVIKNGFKYRVCCVLHYTSAGA